MEKFNCSYDVIRNKRNSSDAAIQAADDVIKGRMKPEDLGNGDR